MPLARDEIDFSTRELWNTRRVEIPGNAISNERTPEVMSPPKRTPANSGVPSPRFGQRELAPDQEDSPNERDGGDSVDQALRSDDDDETQGLWSTAIELACAMRPPGPCAPTRQR